MKNKTPTIKEISESLKLLIEIRVKEILSDQTKSDDTLGELVCELNSIILDGKHNAEDFKKNGLSINAIEAEGFLRCALMVEGILKDYKLI